MKTILVPTDFSKLSKVAVAYAIGIAKKIDARIIVLSVINGAANSKALANWKKYEADLIATAQKDANQLLDEFKPETGKLEIWYRAELGFPIVNKIEEFAVKNKVDLIIMGSKGATGLKKIVMGSNAAAVVDNSSVPVIVVPGGAKFKPIKKLVYATDAKDFVKEVKTIAAFSQQVGASMEVIHVIPANGKVKVAKPADLKVTRDKLIEMARYPKIHLQVIHSDNVSKAVDDFVKTQKTDILAMFTHRLAFNEKLLDKSVTRNLALHNSVPLLAFNRSNQKA